MVIMAKNKKMIGFLSLALLIAFLAGIFFGNSLQSKDIDDLTNNVQQTELATESYMLEQELISNLNASHCDVARLRIQEHSQELYRIGKRLESENAKEHLGEISYTYLKKKYHLLQIRTYTLYKTLSEVCPLQNTVILFYYSQNDPDSALQGKILDSLVFEYPLVVFAVEYRYSSELTFLEQYYNVTKTPGMIIDFDHVFMGKIDRSVLVEYLEHHD